MHGDWTGKVNYALEGSIFVAGAAIQWLRDNMRLIDSSADSEYMAKKKYTEPTAAMWFRHLPDWAHRTGISMREVRSLASQEVPTKNHIIRATLESIDLQVCDVIDAMRADAGVELKSLKVDGGASANNFLMQFQADMINAPVKRPSCIETTAMGAAYLAGLAVGYWKSKEDVIKNQSIDQIFSPQMSEEDRQAKTERLEQSGQIRLRLGERRTGRGRRIDYYSL